MDMTRNPVSSLKRIAARTVYRVYYSHFLEKTSVFQFHKFFYYSEVWQKTSWLGVSVLKSPLDLWVYQEIILEIKPDFIVETGTAHGGSALFLASILDLVNNGKIITVDIEDIKDRPKHKRIQYLLGLSTSKEIVETISSQIGEKDRVMVILDSDHHKEHVLNELRTYCELVSKGSYLIVEDSNINGHPVCEDFGPGPMEAVEEFLSENKNFVVDRDREKFHLTFNPKGYLKRVK